MSVFKSSINISSSDSLEIIDITEDVNNVIMESGVVDGLVNLFSKHSTSAIVVNENEDGLLDDFAMSLVGLVNDEVSYAHDIIDNNAKSHVRAFLLGGSQSIPIRDNRLDLGTWQSIFFIELDGPRSNRSVSVTILD